MAVTLISSSAEFSECGKYRYALHRLWDYSKPVAMCIGLNPSTANAEENDPTISNLMRILHKNGYGGLYMMNLFALISPNPDDLRACPDPVKDNDKWIHTIRPLCDEVIFCWGNFKQAGYRSKIMVQMYHEALCFGKNKNGSPKHPLYLKNNVKLNYYGLTKP